MRLANITRNIRIKARLNESSEIYRDADFENCEANIILNIFRQCGSFTDAYLKHLIRYCADPKRFREEVIAIHNLTDVVICDCKCAVCKDGICGTCGKKYEDLVNSKNQVVKAKEIAKKLPIILMQGGSYKKWKKEWRVDESVNCEFMEGMQLEMLTFPN